MLNRRRRRANDVLCWYDIGTFSERCPTPVCFRMPYLEPRHIFRPTSTDETANAPTTAMASNHTPPPRPIIICGPSGVGKGTLIARLTNKYRTQFGFNISHTTRAPREGEEDAVHYHFCSVEEVKRGIDGGQFLEWAEVHGNYYGTR
jgi:hypothetical protein